MKELYNFDDVTLLPSVMTTITSRQQISVRYEDGSSPYWVAPMDTIICPQNVQEFLDSGANVILPRMGWKNFLFFTDFPNVQHNNQFFIALTLAECEDLVYGKGKDLLKFIDQFQKKYNQLNILIDVANGHMQKIYNIGLALKEKYDNCVLMGGNIAHPCTLMSAIGIFDYMRIGIGGGSRCLTSAKSAIHYPIASLIRECSDIIDIQNLKIKIIADGGIRNIRDVVLAMALGADGVMMGKLYNSCIESCGDTFLIERNEEKHIPNYKEYFYANGTKNLFKQYRGMSCKEVQIKEGKTNIKMCEGFSDFNPVLWDLSTFTHELDSSMRTAMSYIDSKHLTDFKSNSNFALTRNQNNHNKI